MQINIWGDQSNLDLLLVNSPLSDYSKPHPSYTVFWPPMGEAYLASYLSNLGYKVGVLDAESDKLSPLQIAETVAAVSPRWLGFNTFTLTTDVLREIIPLCGDVPTLFGGVGATVSPEMFLKIPEFKNTIVIQNDGEIKVGAILDGRSPVEIPGVCVNNNGKLLINSENPAWFVNIDSPKCQLNRRFVPYDPTIDGNPISPDGKRRAFVASSRGCPYKCKYCASSFLARNGSVRYRKSDLVVSEIKEIVDGGTKDIKFNDDLAFNNRARIGSLLTPLLDQGYGKETGLELRGNGRANVISGLDEETLDLMEKVGIKRIGMGAEQGTRKGMERVNKDITPEDVVTACERLNSRGIGTSINFMFGLPGQDNYETKAVVALARMTVLIGRKYQIKNEVDGCRLHAYPKTEVWDELIKRGFTEEQLTAVEHTSPPPGTPDYFMIPPTYNFGDTDPVLEAECLQTLRDLPSMTDEQLVNLGVVFPPFLFEGEGVPAVERR